MWPVECIEHKRDGNILTKIEIDRFIQDYTNGTIADYQAAAWLMAVFLRGMNARETTDLTMAMAHSGDLVDLSSIPGIKVDKHSTGGIADTTTLIVAPLVAAAGVPVAKMSGRGLGFTGGTVDKLESIPGFHIELSEQQFLRQVRSIGIAVIGQSAEIAAADKLLYALRDATGTVESMPLIASSIMSKKIAAGADAIVLDVKYGDGAFMKTKENARRLAHTMVEIGTLAGRPTRAVVTSMEAPLGTAIGNSLEIDEAVEALAGKGGRRLMEVVSAIGAQMLIVGGKAADEAEGRKKIEELVRSGRGLAKFAEFVKAQGGSTAWIGKRPLTKASQVFTAVCTDVGCITEIHGRALGDIAMSMGAGRARKEDAIDPMVGIRLFKELYDEVRPGEPLFTIYGKADADMTAIAQKIAGHIIVTPSQAAQMEPVVSEMIF
ncbi:thymidine phosphorylase [Megasphaera cerevisiae DSM 20462]|uniref:Pyrimidine-nucleoside phosphorylase n=1 Tax=Megasphaera cerevisiae DSM 20462 TaxID=1122219 RepID=A0A0J6WTT3_9FIRM|nr:thymidine phosphorylase [Megasphaera cerevisiae]KMO85568.1 thymidine phosphorylase [Megasphaera cerevisiae DSM 20462]SKA14792.1 thymidine phosphorylase [Megasphaera cerevisiae DSM 20462]